MFGGFTMKEPIFNASLTIEATPEEAEALNKSNSTVDEKLVKHFGTRWKCKKHLSQKEESRA